MVLWFLMTLKEFLAFLRFRVLGFLVFEVFKV